MPVGLHEGIDDGRADEFETPRAELLETLIETGVEAGTLRGGLEQVDLRLRRLSPRGIGEAGPFSNDLQI